ncbi:MAG: AMP-binding protein [Acidimicrobiales bacterium]
MQPTGAGEARTTRSGATDPMAAARSMAHGAQLARIARKFPDRPAFVCGDEERTFGQVDRRVHRLARGLAGLGLGPGDRLGVLMGNSLEMVETLFAGWRAGAVVVPFNFRLTAPEVAFELSDCSPSVVVADAELAPLLSKACTGLPRPPKVVVLDPAAGGGGGSFADLLADADPAPYEPLVDDRDPALLMYTSGTTGRPKGAVLSHANVALCTLSSMIAMGNGADDEVWYCNLPLFHIGGLSSILPYVLTGGCSVVVPSGHFDVAAAVTEIAERRVTGCVFVGMQWDEACDRLADRSLANRLCLRRASWGAANTPVDVLARIAETIPGVPIYSSFGQTEMSPLTCVLPPQEARRKRGSVGKPIVNVEARLVDDGGAPVPVGEVGEIVYRGPTVMQGYWGMPEATDEAFRDGWFHSGDLCRMDEEGYLYVVDRTTDMIVSGGENIYCPEVEQALRGHPAVADVAVVGIPHPRWGETPQAVVVPVDPARPPGEEELISWCRDRLASYKKPTSVVLVDALPRNAAGKVRKTELRRRAAASPS